MLRICLTGGIACGKTLLSRYLRELGADVLDADDIVHSLVSLEERKENAERAFRDPAFRKELEARLHPQVEKRFEEWFQEPIKGGKVKIAVIPLLFEVHWDPKYDIIVCIQSTSENQIRRMMETRGMSRDDAEARLAAQLPVGEKAARSGYVIVNDSTPEHLRVAAENLYNWLEERG